MLNISQTFDKIETELIERGFTAEQLKKSDDEFTRYLIFYKDKTDEIFGIESSLTFSLNDVLNDVPALYFHVGEIERSNDNSLDLMYVQFIKYTPEITLSIINIIEGKKGLWTGLEMPKTEYTKWKSDKKLLSVH